MAGSTANPRIWLLGDVYFAVLGTSMPTDTTTALAAAWKAIGLLSTDGITESRDEDSSDYFAWGSILYRTVRSKHKRTFKVTAMEDNKDLWGLVNPGSTSTTASTIATRVTKVPSTNPVAFLLVTKDGTITQRRFIARGEVTAVGDVQFSDSDATGRELTITVYPDSAGVLYTDVTDDPQSL